MKGRGGAPLYSTGTKHARPLGSGMFQTDEVIWQSLLFVSRHSRRAFVHTRDRKVSE